MKSLFSTALLRTQSDERLLTLVAAGHERAFETIVQRYSGPLERYCARALSRSESEDVVQQVLMKAWAAVSSGTEVRSLKPWLFRIAQTTIIETVHKSGFDYDELEQSLSPLDGPDSEVEKRALIRKTLVGLATLPEAQREALLRAAVDGESRAEIAQALGVSEGAVRQLLYRARESLRTGATAVTPVPLVVWILKPAGVSGLAQVSAIVAGAGVVAAGPVAVHQLSRHDSAKARAPIERPVPRRPLAKVEAVRWSQATASQRAKAATPATGSGQNVEGRERSKRKSRAGDSSGGTARDDAREQESPEPGEAQVDAGRSEIGARKAKKLERSRETSSRARRNGHADNPEPTKPKTAKQARGDLPRTSHPAGPAESGQDGENTRKDRVKESSEESGSHVGADDADSGSLDGA
jgi:RNA polymerase sigma factor (sigma-70 family)